MKYRLLELLACPQCGEGFTCEEFATSENPDGQVEVDQGILNCPCGAWYPIVDAVPVILPNALDIYSDFAREYADRLPEWSISEEEIRRFEAEKKKTQESFGFEWTIYSTVRDERDDNGEAPHPWVATMTMGQRVWVLRFTEEAFINGWLQESSISRKPRAKIRSSSHLLVSYKPLDNSGLQRTRTAANRRADVVRARIASLSVYIIA